MSFPIGRWLGYPQSVAPQSIEDLTEEIVHAREKFPRGNDLTLALFEEVQELLDELALTEGKTGDRVRAEALQVACVAIRIAEEGDPSWYGSPETAEICESATAVGLLARELLHKKYPKSGGDQRERTA